MRKIDMTGQRFGRLVVLRENGRTKYGKVMWMCKCDCGAEVTVIGNQLRNGHTKSCGCYNRERSSERATERNTTHGMAKTRLYHIWDGVLRRTGVTKGANEKLKRYYIDRGITLCEDWKTFDCFKQWALTHGYSDGLQIDRIDNDKGYFPENCRWVTPKENTSNRRCTVRLEDGKPLALFCSELGIETRGENNKASRQYKRILVAYRKHKIHPELLQQLRQDVRDQARALYEIAMKRQYIQDRVNDLKKVLNTLYSVRRRAI